MKKQAGPSTSSYARPHESLAPPDPTAPDYVGTYSPPPQYAGGPAASHDEGTIVEGLAPVFRADARVLVLGTLPGELSLARQQYYAHPRNSFWRIVAEVFGAGPGLAYEEGVQLLIERRIALWDVCARARRPGSLDTSITAAVPNAFADFFQLAPEIVRICFNGAKAQGLYDRLVMPMQTPMSVTYLGLPSTSPANAATAYDIKLSKWAAALTISADSNGSS